MNVGELAAIDLNLLLVLDSLLAERSVTAAARRHDVTQSAMSHNLARLRDIFDDALLVRVGARMEPTPRADDLVPPLRIALRQLESVLTSRHAFDPSTADMLFTIASTDHGSRVLLPPLMARLQASAPNVRLDIVPFSGGDIATRLARGDIQLAVGVPLSERPGLEGELLVNSSAVSVVRKRHPLLRKKDDLDAFLDTPHCVITPFGMPGSVLDTALAAMGRTRRVALRLPYFLAAPAVIAASNLVLTLPSPLVDVFIGNHPLTSFVPPLEIPSHGIYQLWHERYRHDPSVSWLRTTTAAVFRELAAA